MKAKERKRRAEGQAREMLAALDAFREQRKVDKADLDVALGRGTGYHSHLFGGKIALSAEHVYAILRALEVEPSEFFARLHPPAVTGNASAAVGPITEGDVEAIVERAITRLFEKGALVTEDRGAEVKRKLSDG